MTKVQDISSRIPNEWIDHFVEFEGIVPHFYLDGAGIVTIGIGCTVDRAQAHQLRLFRKSDNFMALTKEIDADFDIVSNSFEGKSRSYYEKLTKLYLCEHDINILFTSRLKTFIAEVNDKVTDISAYPLNAQLVLLDMAFNLGVRGLIKKFPKFLTAFMAKDWKRAAAESLRNGIQLSRNNWTRATLEQLCD